MEETFATAFVVFSFVFGIWVVATTYKGCQESENKVVIERRQQCFEATKKDECFGELK